jgi:hypothetical protein
MRITCDPAKRQRTLQERGLDMRKAKEIQNWSYSFGRHVAPPDESLA